MLSQKLRCSVLWVGDEIICISFKPAVAKPLPHVPKCIALDCKIVVKKKKKKSTNLSSREALKSLGISVAQDFADAALSTLGGFLVGAFLTVKCRLPSFRQTDAQFQRCYLTTTELRH